MTHELPLAGTGWSVWRDVLVRTAGFPADGLDRFTAPDAAAAADALCTGGDGADQFGKAFDEALRSGAVAANEIAADPLFREAVTWQNPGVLASLDGLVAGGPDGPRNVRRRDREKALLKYWQRYCAKSETIGFFGPVSWGRVDDTAATGVRLGTGLVRDRRVFFEAWALQRVAAELGADPAVRRWWAPVPRPHLFLDGRLLRRPLRPPLELSTVDAAVLARCTGDTPAHRVVAGLVADGRVRTEADGYLLLDRLVAREVLCWDAGLPTSPAAEPVLRERIAAIGDDEVRAGAAERLGRLTGARDAVVAAAGDPVALRAALSTLDEVFTELTGARPRRRDGQTYAGRTLTYEDTTRDLDLVVGRGLIESLAAPLSIVLAAARWLSAEFGAACERICADLYADLGAVGPVWLGDFWALVQGMFFADADSPAHAIGAEFTARWARLFGLDGVPAGQAEVRLAAADLTDAAAEVFAATGPGWPSARVHSADIQVCARDVADLDRDDVTLVLGELHPAYDPFDSALFSPWHPDPAALTAAHDTTFGARPRLLYPESAHRITGRARHGLVGSADTELAVADTRGATAGRLVAASALRVRDQDGELTATAPDGLAWPVVETFGDVLTALLLDSFKLVGPAAHNPRIVIDRLVVARRTWRTTVAATGLTDVTGEAERFLAARRLRLALGLPERVFVKVGTELKPCFVDLAGPAHVQVLATMLRTAARSGPGVSVTFSEQLPVTEDAWLPDPAGRRYVSELRFQLTDPATYQPRGARG